MSKPASAFKDGDHIRVVEAGPDHYYTPFGYEAVIVSGVSDEIQTYGEGPYILDNAGDALGVSWWGIKDVRWELVQPAPYDAGSPLPTETLFGTIITFEGTPLRDMDRDGLIRVIEYLGPKVHPEVFGRAV